MLQYFAVLTMLLDHIGIVFYPENALLRIVGRIAMPIYVYACAVAIDHTKDFKKYCYRLLMIAIIAQIPFMIALQAFELNIVFNLLLSVMTIHFLKKQNNFYSFKAISIIFISVILSLFMEYSFYGLFLMLGFYFIKNNYVILSYHFVLNILVLIIFEWEIQIMSIFATILILYKDSLPEIKMNKLFYRTFYPLHLTLLAALKFLIN